MKTLSEFASISLSIPVTTVAMERNFSQKDPSME